MKRIKLIALFSFFVSYGAHSQISPPGLGEANTASWIAIGLRQNMDTLSKWQSVTYLGWGRKSSPVDYSPVSKNAILVLNQEFYRLFCKNFQYSMALSYRRQDEYSDIAPYVYKTNRIKQEFRLYGRLAYSYKVNRFKISPILRQEFRTFYAADFSKLSEVFQFRTRIRLQLSLNLDKKSVNKIAVNAESLFTASLSNSNSWSGYNYSESRFSVYYSLSPKRLPMTISIGYMNNLIGERSHSVHYFAIDVVLENLFKSK